MNKWRDRLLFAALVAALLYFVFVPADKFSSRLISRSTSGQSTP